jgi:H+/Cl- antiporter ClcA
VVVAVDHSTNQSGIRGPVDEPDRALVPQEQLLRHVADRRPAAIVMAGFSVLFGAPFGAAVFALEIQHRRGLQYYEAVLPAVIGSFGGYVVYVTVDRSRLNPIFHLPAAPALRPTDLAWAAAAGAGGAAAATAFTYLSTGLRWAARRLRPELRPVLGGLVLAALGLLSAYALTFGEA